MKIKHFSAQNDTPAYALISDWTTLASALNLKTNLLSWVLHERDKMQTRIRIGKRTVYKSAPALQKVQTRLTLLLDPLLDTLPDNEVVLSYRKGTSPQSALDKYAGAKMLIGFDIRHYYDNVRLSHMSYALQQVGFCKAGAKLISRYCLVKRGDVHTLQQGCAASPAMSNLVGYYYIDQPILTWLRTEWPELKYKYVRYCDNVELFLDEAEPTGFREAYKTFVKNTLKESGFRTHDWSCVSDSHPKRNMRFLGVILNRKPRLDKKRMDDMRAMFFNMAQHGLKTAQEEFSKRYCNGINLEITKYIAVLRGHVAYISSVNKRHGTWCKKLLNFSIKVYEHMHNEMYTTMSVDKIYKQHDDIRTALLSYKDDTESVDDFVNRLLALCDTVLKNKKNELGKVIY